LVVKNYVLLVDITNEHYYSFLVLKFKAIQRALIWTVY